MKKTIRVIALDFGSSQSSIAIMEIGSFTPPELLNLGGGRNGVTMPTVLALDENDGSLRACGNAVREKYRDVDSGDLKYVSDFKRYLGAATVKDGDPPEVTELRKNAEQYARLFIGEMAKKVKNHFGMELDPSDFVTVVAHPATWSEDGERVELLKRIVADAGFPVDPEYGIRTLPEPVAAMHSLRMPGMEMLKFKFDARPEYFMVIDFGGGTLDICIVKTDILGRTPKIVSTSGDPELGGKDFDDILLKFFLRNNRGFFDKDRLTSADMRELKDKINEAKETFSANFKDTEFSTCSLHLSQGTFQFPLARQEFYNTCEDQGVFDKIKSCIQSAMTSAKLGCDQISKVILTGGSCKWPFIRTIVAKEFGIGGADICLTDTPFTDVANGCAIAIGLPDAPPDKKGVWVKWRLSSDTKWRDPKCLVEPSSGDTVGHSERQYLGSLPNTKYLVPYELYLSWWRGFTADELEPDGDEAVVSVFARANAPFLDRFRRMGKAFAGQRLDDLEDTYDLYLNYEIEAGGTCSYRFEILDRRAAEYEKAWIKAGCPKEPLQGVSQGWRDGGRIVPGYVSYCGLIGFGSRKSREIRRQECLEESATEKGRQHRTLLSRCKSLISTCMFWKKSKKD